MAKPLCEHADHLRKRTSRARALSNAIMSKSAEAIFVALHPKEEKRRVHRLKKNSVTNDHVQKMESPVATTIQPPTGIKTIQENTTGTVAKILEKPATGERKTPSVRILGQLGDVVVIPIGAFIKSAELEGVWDIQDENGDSLGKDWYKPEGVGSDGDLAQRNLFERLIRARIIRQGGEGGTYWKWDEGQGNFIQTTAPETASEKPQEDSIDTRLAQLGIVKMGKDRTYGWPNAKLEGEWQVWNEKEWYEPEGESTDSENARRNLLVNFMRAKYIKQGGPEPKYWAWDEGQKKFLSIPAPTL